MKTRAPTPHLVPWRYGNFELSETAIKSLLDLTDVGPSDVFVDLGSGTGSVVIKAVELWNVKMAIGVEIETKNRDSARRNAIRTLTRDRLERVDFWLGNIESDDFDYRNATVVYDSFEEYDKEIVFYRSRFAVKHLRVVKKDLPFVGYAPTKASRVGRTWFFRMDFPLHRIRKKSAWASLVLDRPNATLEDVYEYYRFALSKRGISRKETELALNNLERLELLRF